MWKVLLALVTHRLFLLLVALVALNHSLPVAPQRTSMLPQIHPLPELMQLLVQHIDDTPEVVTVRRQITESAAQTMRDTPNPYFWLGRWMVLLTGLSPALALILLSNAFLILFLGELNALFNRMVTPDVAASATCLIVLWPTSYELSLGAAFSFTCFALTLAVRSALDNQWLIAGLAAAMLALAEPVVLGLLPLSLFIFWYFQRHFKTDQILKRAVFFFVPLGLALVWGAKAYSSLGSLFADSALMHIYRGATRDRSLAWTMSKSLAGQTIAIVFFGIGAVTAFFSNTTLVHRLIPANMWLVLLLFSPYSALASRAPLAAACLEGITSASSAAVLKLVQVLMLALGIYEVASVFG